MGVDVRLFGDFDIRGVPLRVSATFGGEATVFEARLGDLSLGEVIEYVVGLAVPSLEVKLPPPWNALESVSLRDLVLRMDVTHGSVSVLKERIDLDLGFLRLDALELTYGGEGSDGVGAVDLKLYGRLLERTYRDPPLSWDLLSEPPPAVPSGASPAFRLDYLGLGQRVTLRDPSKLGDMASVVAALEEAGADVPDSSDPLRDLSTLRFDPAAGWLIGASFSVLGTLRLMAVFNDPALYGLRLELAGERAKKLAGLEFEILYRKVGPGLGVYHLELELPESMRHLELGAMSVTMPYIVVDVWTNGDFMVDLGFPHGLDFSRSFTFQTFVGPVPVVGAGGFYFGALSSGTSSAVPRVSNGRFAPVLAFGIGLQVGVGRTIEMGMLRAGIVIAVEGLLEGAVAFFEPEDRGVGSDVWYRVRGTVALVGHIYGEIDFAIVKARVDIRAYASASITLEAYAATEVVLQAGVSADLKVKVAFFHVHLSFRAQLRQSLTLGRAGHAPWRLEPAAPRLGTVGPAATARGGHGSAWLRALEAPGSFGTPGLMDAGGTAREVGRARTGRSRLHAGAPDTPRPWEGARVAREVRTLDLYLQPVVTVGATTDRPDADAGEDAPAVQLLALLFMPRGRAGSGPAGFDDLAWAALQWAVTAARGGAPGTAGEPDGVDRADLARAFHDLVASGDPERVGFCDIADFLRENFQLRIRPLPSDAAARAAVREDGLTLFPVPPYLTLKAELAGHEADLQRHNPCSPAYRALVDEYFRRLHPEPPPERERGPGVGAAAGAPGGPPPDSMAAFVFADASRLVLRAVLRAGLDAFGGWEAGAGDGDSLADVARRYGVPGEEPVDDLALANQDSTDFWADGSTLTLSDLRVRVREGESPDDLAARAGVELGALAVHAAEAPGILRPGATLRIEGGRVRPRAGDTVVTLAARLSTSVEALLATNPALPWPPGPHGLDELPAGTVVSVPTIDVRVRRSDTLGRVGGRFGLSAEDLLGKPENAGADDLLAPAAAVPLPSLAHTVAEGDTPAALARRLGLSVRELVSRTDRAGAAYGRVRVPGCRRLPPEELRAALRDRGAFDAVAGSLSRFLLAGLRLPDPGAHRSGAHRSGARPDDPGATDWSGLPLFPLYVLTGQQWPCAAGDPAAERVTLRRNPIDADEACQRPLITFDSETPDEGLSVGLGAEETALVDEYRALAESGRPVEPQLLAATRAAPFVVVPRRFAVGEATPWHAARAPDWGQGDDAGGDPVILPLPEALCTLLRRNPRRSQDPRLVVRAASPEGEAPGAAREVEARAWATRIEMEIRRSPDPGRPGGFLPSVVEVFSTDGGGRRRLLELVEHLRAHRERVARIHLLRASDPTAAGGAALRSDALDPADVVLLKTNLSTWTRPPSPPAMRARAGEEEPEAPLHASLAEPLPFLRLLWEAAVVAGGGCHLVYPVGENGALPDGLFGRGDAATLTVLVVVSPAADSERSVPAEPFHDCVVSAEAPGDGTPFVEPPLFAVDEPVALPALAQSLQVEPGELVLANASVAGLVKPGTSLELPDVGTRVVQPGDDLLSLAMMLPEPSLDAVAAAVAAAGAVIPAGARGWTHPSWVSVRPTLGPGRVAFRVLRTDPDPEPVGAAADAGASAQDDPRTRLRALYNLLDARVERHGPFEASPRTLPVAPAEVDDAEALNPVPETPAAPWRYERVLGVGGLEAGAAAGGPGRAHPYPGMGGEALLSFRLLDVFGNRCPPADALPPVSVPIRYTDALVGPGQWPGVAVGYRFVRSSAPRLELRASVDVARTSPGPGAPLGPVRERAAADRRTFAVVRRQLEREDLRIQVASTIDGEPQELGREGFVGFTTEVDRWLATVEALEEAADAVREGDTPAAIARRWRIPLDALAAANAGDPGLLAAGTGTLRVPVLHVFARNDTLALVAAGGPDAVTPAELARRNRAVPLREGAEVTAGGRRVPVVAGATLASIARDAGVEANALGEENAGVADLFAPGTRLLVAARTADVAAGSTLAALAADHGLGAADLLAVNAASPSLLAEGARVAIPDHVRPGEEAAATVKVRDGDTLASLARRVGVGPGALVQANLALDGLLAVREPATVLEAVSRTGNRVRTSVLEGDTLATALHRLRAHPGCDGVDAGALARANADRKGLLEAGVPALAPPRAADEAVPVAPAWKEVIFPLRVWLDLLRDPERVDPALPPDSPVRSVRTGLSPTLGGGGEGGRQAHGLDAFARDFRDAFPELRLATASGTGAGDGRIALFAVQLQNQTVNWRIGAKPVFFAPRPLLAVRWSTPTDLPAAIRPYADGALGPPAPRDFHDVDLDVWGRELLEAVDRFLGPDHAVTAQRLCAAAESDAYDTVVRGKAALAAAIRDSVEPVLDPEEGDPPGDAEAAREALYQRVLAELGEAYRVDSIVQLPVTVNSPFGDRALAPRLYGRVAAATRTVSEGATLADQADHFGAPVAVVAGMLARDGALLTEGAAITVDGRTHVVGPADTLTTAAAALDVELPELARAVAHEAGLLRPGASVPLVPRRHTVGEDDTLGTVIEAMADGGGLADAIPVFAALNADVSALLRKGVPVRVGTVPVREGDTLLSIAKRLAASYSRLGDVNAETRDALRAGAVVEVGDARWTVREGESLRDVAEALGVQMVRLSAAVQQQRGLLRPGALLRRVRPLEGSVGPAGRLGDVAEGLGIGVEDLVAAQLDTPDLLREGTEARWLARRPVLTLSDVKVPLAEGASLTFLVRTSGPRRSRRVPLDPELRVSALEHDVRDVPWAGAYQASEWLTLVEPVGERLHPMDVPVPLRSHPVPPAILGQEIRRRVPDEPDVADLRRYDYRMTYAYERAAQDQLVFDTEVNVPDAMAMAMRSGEDETLPYLLAQYDAVAEPLWRDLGRLREPDALSGDPDATAVVLGAVGVFADLVRRLGAAWAAWEPPGTVLRPGAGAGPVTAEASGGPGGGADEGAPVRVRPSGVGGSPSIAESVLGQDVQGLDALRTQNIRGRVRVLRNADLLAGRATNPAFVYRVPPSGPVSKAWPLLEHRAILRLPPAAPGALPGRLADLFARFLDVTAESPDEEARPVRVSVSWIFPLGEAAPARGDGAGPALVVEVPVALSPAAPFVPARDLAGDEGLCARLTARLIRWVEERGGGGGEFRFDLAAYANLPRDPGAGGAKPLVELRDVRLPVEPGAP